MGLVLFFVMVSWLYGVGPLHSQTVAVFPVEDLSQGVNSTNMEMTRHLTAELQAKGLHTVLEEDIISFMAAKRVRWLGYLDTDQILQIQENLGADLILFGTITQQSEKRSPTFGLSLQLVRTRDAKTVWSASAGLGLADMQRLLGLHEPTTLEELWPVLVRNVLEKWPADLDDDIAAQPLLFDTETGELPPTLQIKNLSLSPRYVRPGEQVKCAIEIDNTDSSAEQPQVFIRVGTRVHLAQQTKEGLFYEASWTGSEIEKGIFREVGHEALKLAAADLSSQYFEGIWAGFDEDNIYPVSLILKWPSGEQQMAFVGNYTVDSTPPDIDMFIKGMTLMEDLVTFNDRILILPKMKGREPSSHWRIWVEDDMGRTVLQDEADGKLPRNFYWKGEKFNGQLVKDGIYRLILKVWDRAGNEAMTSQEVVFRSSRPDLIMDIKKDGQGLYLSIDTEDKGIPLSFWKLEVWNDDGDLLQKSDGTELPMQFDIPLQEDFEKEAIEGTVVLRDVLGNQTRVNVSDLFLMALQEDDLEEEETSEATEDEDDTWAWYSDF
jgi:hypothetical protein